MIAAEKSHQNRSDYNKFLFNKSFKVFKNRFFLVKKRINSGNYIYDYAHSFFGEDF